MVQVRASVEVGSDLGVRSVLVEVIVEKRSAGRRGGDEEIAIIGRSIGERDRRLVPSLEDVEDLGQKVAREISPPERSIAARIFDERPGVTDKGRIEAELPGHRQGPSIPSTRAEDRPDPRTSRAIDRLDGPRA